MKLLRNDAGNMFMHIIGRSNLAAMLNVSQNPSLQHPLHIQSMEIPEFDIAPLIGGQYLSFASGSDVKGNSQIYNITKNWQIEAHDVQKFTAEQYRSRLRHVFSPCDPINGSYEHNLMIGTVGHEHVLTKYAAWWDSNIRKVGKLMESVVDRHPWVREPDYVSWRDSSEHISGFGGNNAQLYDKRRVSIARLHDELGWSCAANLLVADRTVGQNGASMWIGVNRDSLEAVGYTNADILKFYERLDIKDMLHEWINKGVNVSYCMQKVGDLVISTPGNGAMHLVISLGDLVQVSINHGFTMSGYNRCLEAWSNLEADVWYNSGLATRHIIGRDRMQIAFPKLRFVK